MFFLGGIAKNRVLEELRPHIFFDDQVQHVEGVAGVTPSAHVPFGVANEPSPELVQAAHAEKVWLKKRDKAKLRRSQVIGRRRARRRA